MGGVPARRAGAARGRRRRGSSGHEDGEDEERAEQEQHDEARHEQHAAPAPAARNPLGLGLALPTFAHHGSAWQPRGLLAEPSPRWPVATPFGYRRRVKFCSVHELEELRGFKWTTRPRAPGKYQPSVVLPAHGGGASEHSTEEK